MNGEVVRLLEKFVERYQCYAHSFGLFSSNDGIVTKDGHFERLRKASQACTNSAQPDDSKGVFCHVSIRKFIALLPLSPLHNSVTEWDLLHQSQEESQSPFSHCKPADGC